MWIKIAKEAICLSCNSFLTSNRITKTLVNPEIGCTLKSWKQGRSKEGSKAIEEEKRLLRGGVIESQILHLYFEVTAKAKIKLAFRGTDLSEPEGRSAQVGRPFRLLGGAVGRTARILRAAKPAGQW